ncbi:ATP-dependent DNA helicase sgs1 [Haplosporangium sp. Z 11]|nr:ATP-dependent DNA helicase sgs1 [Haplosporangium sp. Z 11]
MLWNNRVIIVISPRKLSIQEQQLKLQDFGTNSISLDKERSIESNTLDELADGAFAVVFMTPEVIFHINRLRSLWNRATWWRRLKAVFLDDAHCINTWGSPFRTANELMEDLRSWISPSVAFVALSTAFPPGTLEDVKSCAHFKPGVAVFGVRNDPSNVRLEVRHLHQHKDNVKQLNFLMDFQKTIVYFETMSEVRKVQEYLQALTPDINKSKISTYRDYMSKDRRQIILEAFKRNEILLLLSTEVHEIDCKVNDVVRVVQFKCPAAILCLVQRFDRAARDPSLQGLDILFAETKSTTDLCLTQYITTKDCRWKVLNAAFDNENWPDGNCCYLCHPSLETLHLQTDAIFKDVHAVDQTVDQAKKAIRTWRAMAYERDYRPRYVFSRKAV